MEHFKRGWVSSREGEWKAVIEEVRRCYYRAESEADALRILAAEKETEEIRGEFFAYDRFPIKDEEAEILGIRYRVFYSMSPDKGEEYETREEAEQAALAQANEIAEREGIEPEEVSIYGGPLEREGWGACPRDCYEACYPEISITLR